MRGTTKAGWLSLPHSAPSAFGYACALFFGFAAIDCLSTQSNNCSGPTSYQVFQSMQPASAVPLCTDATDASAMTVQSEGGAYSLFGGASPLSAEGFAQCAALCAGATSTVPCCLSQWEPQTVVCTPSCP